MALTRTSGPLQSGCKQCHQQIAAQHFLALEEEVYDKKFVLGAIDIGDACLTVPQLQPTLVTSGTQSFALGRVLPGQRDRSQLWFDSVTNFLHEKLGFEHCSAYPSFLRSPGGECLILLHVDDMLVVTDEEFFSWEAHPNFD